MLVLFMVFIYVYTIVQGYQSAFFSVYTLMGLLVSLILLGLYGKMKAKKVYFISLSLALIGLSLYNETFAYLFSIALVLGAMEGLYYVLLGGVVLVVVFKSPILMAFYFLSTLLGMSMGSNAKIREAHVQAMDAGRRNIYALESAKAKLNKNSQDLVRLTELNERNRIARSIHDNLGHKLVGSKMILEAAYALKDTNKSKADGLIKRVVCELESSVDLLRDTVHDLKPAEDVGLNHLKAIIERFNYATVDFNHQGDLNAISSGLYAVMAVNLKEAFTNISKYSSGDHVEVILEHTGKYTRLIVKDNGQGQTLINEGLGISGMRQRVNNIGGTFTVNHQDGFQLYMFFPIGGKQ